ncbi:MAG: DUF2325 domain-containing protein [Geminicoccaceae bacterium]|nr:DUF2325 domain-containing protein [Geminicoccaceae bacterium]
MHDRTRRILPLDQDLELEKALAPDDVRSASEGGLPRRLMLWEVRSNMHCSIVGTCLDRAELSAVMRRARLRPVEGSSEYEVHAWFVCQCTESSRVAKFAHKLLDRKYAAAIRRHMQLTTREDILKNWDEARRNGLIAGVYWAIASDARTGESLRQRVFGDVHMMSHFMTGRNRQDARAVHLAEERIACLDDRLVRVRMRHEQAIGERDARIGDLEREVLTLRAFVVNNSLKQPGAPVRTLGKCRTARSIKNQSRRTAAARAMLKDAQAEIERLQRQVELLSEAAVPDKPQQPPSDDHDPVACASRRFGNWLYVGGRSTTYPYLRRGAEAFCEQLDFHDGGLEQSLLTLDDLVAQAEVVFCPVDCVSHGACLKAKKLCRQMAKTFVPLRSASSSHFRRIAGQLVRSEPNVIRHSPPREGS